MVEDTLPFNQIVIFGRHSEDWMLALGTKAEVWKLLGYEGQVLEALTFQELAGLSENVVVIPLLEDNILNLPNRLNSLIPSKQALGIFRDKLKFSKYVNQHGLSTFCPKIYLDENQILFPCVLKRTDLNAGYGLRFINSKNDLRLALDEEIFQNQDYIIQEFIPGSIEYVTHCICKNGEILWHTTYHCELLDKQNMQSPKVRTKVNTPASFLNVAKRFLEPVSFSGPCNFDYKFNAESQLIIFEINPRFGGSLLRPEYVNDLKSALETLFSMVRISKPGLLKYFKSDSWIKRLVRADSF